MLLFSLIPFSYILSFKYSTFLLNVSLNKNKNDFFSFLHLTLFLINQFFILKKIIFLKSLNFSILKSLNFFKKIIFFLNIPFFKILKAYGINMRIRRLNKKKLSSILYIRLGYSHGFFIKLPKLLFFRIFKRRYFIISGFDFFYLQNLIYQLRYLRIFFRYKLIGIKLVRDYFKIKIGKKKTF